MEPAPHEVTELLTRAGTGDTLAEERLFEIVMPQLRRLAGHMLQGERRNHTMQATELVNQVYVRLAGAELSLRNRAHFFAIAARAMRRELIDYARRRPDVAVMSLDGIPETALAHTGRHELALTIDQLLDTLRQTMPIECSIVELKFFFGMTDQETADALSLPLRTMQAKWQDARIWLFERAEAQQWRPTNKPPTS